VHFNESGHEVVAKEIASAIENLHKRKI